MTAGLANIGRAVRRAALHAQLRADVVADQAPLELDENRFEPIPPDEQQLPSHRVHPRDEEPRRYWLD